MAFIEVKPEKLNVNIFNMIKTGWCSRQAILMIVIP